MKQQLNTPVGPDYRRRRHRLEGPRSTRRCQSPLICEGGSADPDNTAEQEVLEDNFRERGMETPSSLGGHRQRGAPGDCSPPMKTSGALTKRSLSSCS